MDVSQRVGQLPPIADSDSEDDSGLMANMNSTLSTVALSPPDEAPAVSNSRLGVKTAEQVAQARKDRKANAGKGVKKVAKGSDDSGSEAEANDNKNQGKTMKMADLGAPREMSRREK